MAERNFYIDSNADPHEVAQEALRWLLASPVRKVYLAVIQNSNVEIGTLNDLLGRRVVRDFISRGSAILNGHEAVLVTHKRRLYVAEPSRLAAFYPSREFLDELDTIPTLTDMLVVPFMADEIREWKAARSAVPLGGQPAAKAPFHISDRIVEAAVRTLDATANKSTGLVHPRDRATAIQVFKTLRDNGYAFDPEEIKVFLVSERDLEAPKADEVKVVATQILQGKKLRPDEKRFRDNILDIWREEAAKLS